MDWQPIETAPKDGTRIDVWVRGGYRLPDVAWSSSLSGWGRKERRGRGKNSFTVNIVRTGDDTTHWMPLPAPPTSSTGAAGAKSPAVVERSAFVCGIAGEML